MLKRLCILFAAIIAFAATAAGGYVIGLKKGIEYVRTPSVVTQVHINKDGIMNGREYLRTLYRSLVTFDEPLFYFARPAMLAEMKHLADDLNATTWQGLLSREYLQRGDIEQAAHYARMAAINGYFAPLARLILGAPNFTPTAQDLAMLEQHAAASSIPMEASLLATYYTRINNQEAATHWHEVMDAKTGHPLTPPACFTVPPVQSY